MCRRSDLGTLTRHTLAMLLSLLLLCAAGCTTPDTSEDSAANGMDSPTATRDDDTSDDVDLGSAEYELVFKATWSSLTHPTDFPSDPHFSGLIGAAHSPDATVWEDGMLASPGIKNMAETGGKTPLDSEIEQLIAEGNTCELISGSGIKPAPGEASVTFTVTEECPLVSVVSMIAPSPDWFVGVSSLDLRGDGEWIDQLAIDLYPWDAGTDSGETYAAANDPTVEPEPVFLMAPAPPIAVDGEIPSFGTFTFTRVDG